MANAMPTATATIARWTIATPSPVLPRIRRGYLVVLIQVLCSLAPRDLAVDELDPVGCASLEILRTRRCRKCVACFLKPVGIEQCSTELHLDVVRPLHVLRSQRSPVGTGRTLPVAELIVGLPQE